MKTFLVITYLFYGQIKIQRVEYESYEECHKQELLLIDNWTKNEAHLRALGLQDISSFCAIPNRKVL